MIAPQGRVVLVRHGETEWSRVDKHTGRTDLPLTAAGEAKAKAVGAALQALGLRDPLVLASPRKRAIRTAEVAGFPVRRVWDDLAEWDYGDYEGLTTPQIRERAPHWTVWTHPCPGGESAESVQSRADTVIDVANAQLAEHDVLFFGHGHFSRVLTARWISLPVAEGRRFALGPASYTVLGFEHEKAQVICANVTCGPSA